jgi:Zn-dependent protease
MAQSYRIGSLFGIGIELHWTFILLLLACLLLSTYLFLLIALLFVCVLIHEVAHSITCKRNNVRVKKIILLPIGGASIIDDAKLSPEVEFNVAISGPLMSIFLGCLFGVLVIFAPLGLPTMILQFLFIMNIFLGVFNLMPAFPTDGGRVFRSYLERRHDEYTATMLTVKASKYTLAIFLVGSLAYLVFTGASLFNIEFILLWDLLIVFYLYGGAMAEKQTAELKRDAKGLSVRGAVTKHFALVGPGTSVRDLYGLAAKSGEHLFITKLPEGYAYVNLLSTRRRGNPTSARDLSARIPSMPVGTGLVDALQMMGSAEASMGAVTDRGRLVGIVTLSSLQTFLSLHVLNKKGNTTDKPSAPMTA